MKISNHSSIYKKQSGKLRGIFLVLAGISVVLLAGCAGTAGVPANQGAIIYTQPGSIFVDNATSLTLTVSPLPAKPDKVELLYFHTANPCHCMAVVGDNIKYAIDTYFASEVSGGRVKLTMIVSDDPANADLMKKYDAMLFTLFIKETRGSDEKIYPVSDIWNMTGDENREKLVNFIRYKVNAVLEGKS